MMRSKIDASGISIDDLARGLAVELEAFPSKAVQELSPPPSVRTGKIIIKNILDAQLDETGVALDAPAPHQEQLAAEIIFNALKYLTLEYLTIKSTKGIAELIYDEVVEFEIEGEIDITQKILENSKLHQELHYSYVNNTDFFVSGEQNMERMKNYLMPLFRMGAEETLKARAQINTEMQKVHADNASTKQLLLDIANQLGVKGK